MPLPYARIAKYLLVASLAIGAPALSLHPGSNVFESPGTEARVYICASPTAYAYHENKKCRGLSRCTHEVKELTKADAAAKRRPCKICL